MQPARRHLPPLAGVVPDLVRVRTDPNCTRIIRSGPGGGVGWHSALCPPSKETGPTFHRQLIICELPHNKSGVRFTEWGRLNASAPICIGTRHAIVGAFSLSRPCQHLKRTESQNSSACFLDAMPKAVSLLHNQTLRPIAGGSLPARTLSGCLPGKVKRAKADNILLAAIGIWILSTYWAQCAQAVLVFATILGRL